jgi:hypothetical protein
MARKLTDEQRLDRWRERIRRLPPRPADPMDNYELWTRHLHLEARLETLRHLVNLDCMVERHAAHCRYRDD